MTGTLKRRVQLLIATTATAVFCWKFVPGSALDRAAFALVVRGFANPPIVISGDGSHGVPWELRTLSATGKAGGKPAAVLVSLGDDPEGFFQTSPPSPIDLAVVFTNLQRLGATRAATAAALSWDAPDPIGLMALDKAIGRFDSLVMAAPLTRGAVASAMPTAFRNASIPLSAIHGDTSQLPIVNRIPLPDIILGKENVLAGFQALESEPDTGFAPLLARWNDRAVFAFPLLVVLQRLGLSPAEVEVQMGEHLKLGPDGPIVPLDRFGRLAVRLKSAPRCAEIPAESLIDAGDDFLAFSNNPPVPVILVDKRSAAEATTRAFTSKLPAVISTIASDSTLAAPQAYPRLRSGIEVGLLALVAAALAGMSALPAFARNIALLVGTAACVAAQCLAAGMFGLWLPGLPALAAVAVAVTGFMTLRKKPVAPIPPAIVPTVETLEPPVVSALEAAPSAPKPTPPRTPKKRPSHGKKRRR